MPLVRVEQADLDTLIRCLPALGTMATDEREAVLRLIRAVPEVSRDSLSLPRPEGRRVTLLGFVESRQETSISDAVSAGISRTRQSANSGLHALHAQGRIRRVGVGVYAPMT